ncbi:hypothetical protein CEXT_745921 [Caerostris extrusa]|uniref:Uncharacterized protein n=1 Tax=Caerostris extrusa TaxID=172846 RepID=A0AAV4XMH6_CAEEX|nr:hypothetical protein CEXT_745921 [Caerostris extrusa]
MEGCGDGGGVKWIIVENESWSDDSASRAICGRRLGYQSLQGGLSDFEKVKTKQSTHYDELTERRFERGGARGWSNVMIVDCLHLSSNGYGEERPLELGSTPTKWISEEELQSLT